MSEFKANLLTDTDRESWDTLWDNSKRYLSLHWRWVELASRGSGTPIRIGVFDKGGRLRAGVAFVQRRNRWMTEWRHPAPAPFAGWLRAMGDTSESFHRDALVALATAIPPSIDFVELIFPPETHDVRGLTWSGWRAEPFYNYTSPLRPLEQFAERPESAVHRQARKAREAGYVTLTGLQYLDSLLSQWESTRQRQKIPSYVKPEALRELAQWLHNDPPSGLGGEIVGLKSASGEMETGAFVGWDSHRVYYILGASDLEALGSGSPTLLHFEIAQLAAKREWPDRYDWVGANTRTIAQFKKKFKPDVENLVRTTRTRPLRRLLEAIRGIFN